MQNIVSPSSRELRQRGGDRGKAETETRGLEEPYGFKTGQSKASAQRRLSSFTFSHSHMCHSAPCSTS